MSKPVLDSAENNFPGQPEIQADKFPSHSSKETFFLAKVFETMLSLTNKEHATLC
ncbi:MAG: hypothetical protein AB8B97_02665 [Granulosicoccus sp.]